MRLGYLAIWMGLASQFVVIGAKRLQQSVIRSAEVSAIADSRRVIRAQQTYASANGGYFDDLTRLCRTGSGCAGIGIPDYPEDGPDFIEAELARPSPYRRDQYDRTWVGGPKLERPGEGVSPTSVLDYCYISGPGSWLVRGGRWYCGRGSRSICSEPEPQDLCDYD